MSRAVREAVADWLMLLAALVLVLSLFLTWSHQFPVQLRGVIALRGVPRDPTGWQVYSVADVCLALVAYGLVRRREDVDAALAAGADAVMTAPPRP